MSQTHFLILLAVTLLGFNVISRKIDRNIERMDERIKTFNELLKEKK